MNGIVGSLVIIINAIFVNNIVMSQFLGICPFLGVSKKLDTAVSMGLAVTFVMALSSIFTYIIQHALLVPLHIEYMQTIVFILVIASLVQLVEMVIQKMSPPLYSALGIYLPLITTNCAVLGAAITNIQQGYSLINTLISGTSVGLSFLFAITLFAGIRERLENSNIPECMKGFPISLISAGLMSIAFFGFAGLTNGLMA